ncbi:MAG: hypothetical protein CMJ85_12155 [Planctomycetes bacterium]|jgi:uncharacterized membrane protein YdjX (TVP38/TMEM64 family)|nr:hypothetical protein [Planctomycetota bacterium]
MEPNEAQTAGESQQTPAAVSLGALLIPPLIATAVFAGALALLHVTGVLELVYDRERLQEWIRGKGAWAPIAFIAILTIRPLTLFPSVFVAPITVELFGLAYGTCYKVLGATCGATVAFTVSRYGFSRAVSGFLRRVLPGLSGSMDAGLVGRLGKVVERRGLLSVLALRLNLVLPFDALNYGLGFTTVKLRHYLLGTLVGIIPGTFLYLWLSDGMLRGDWRMAVAAIISIAVMVLLSVPIARDVIVKQEPESQP